MAEMKWGDEKAVVILASSYFNNHQILIEESKLSGRVTVKYDGRKVSDKLSLTTLGRHVFQVQEDGQSVHYEVDIGFGWTRLKIRILRNRIVIFSNEDGFTPPPQPLQLQKPQQAEREVTREIHVREVVLVVCPHCGHRNDSSLRKCERCGASI